MLKQFDEMLGDLALSPVDLAPRRFGRVTASDGGLIEVTGLSVPIGGLCRIDDGKGAMLTAEAIGFRNGRTMMMMLGDSVLLRPGVPVRPEGRLRVLGRSLRQIRVRRLRRSDPASGPPGPQGRSGPAGVRSAGRVRTRRGCAAGRAED